MKLTAKHTIAAGFVGYLTQAITINFAPLLFLTFEKEYGSSETLYSMGSCAPQVPAFRKIRTHPRRNRSGRMCAAITTSRQEPVM